jgi:hypothetical protein
MYIADKLIYEPRIIISTNNFMKAELLHKLLGGKCETIPKIDLIPDQGKKLLEVVNEI